MFQGSLFPESKGYDSEIKSDNDDAYTEIDSAEQTLCLDKSHIGPSIQ